MQVEESYIILSLSCLALSSWGPESWYTGIRITYYLVTVLLGAEVLKYSTGINSSIIFSLSCFVFLGVGVLEYTCTLYSTCMLYSR